MRSTARLQKAAGPADVGRAAFLLLYAAASSMPAAANTHAISATYSLSW